MSRLAIALVLVLAGCGSKTQPVIKPPTTDTPAQASVTLDVEPADATVEIDGGQRGTAASLGGKITLSRGVHQIVLSKQGFEVWRGELEVANQSETLQVKLVPATVPRA